MTGGDYKLANQAHCCVCGFIFPVGLIETHFIIQRPQSVCVLCFFSCCCRRRFYEGGKYTLVFIPLEEVVFATFFAESDIKVRFCNSSWFLFL